jgi:hypothetical protein
LVVEGVNAHRQLCLVGVGLDHPSGLPDLKGGEAVGGTISADEVIGSGVAVGFSDFVQGFSKVGRVANIGGLDGGPNLGRSPRARCHDAAGPQCRDGLANRIVEVADPGQGQRRVRPSTRPGNGISPPRPPWMG